MWKNWIPFRKKQKDSEIPTNLGNGKENTVGNIHHQENHPTSSTGVKSHFPASSSASFDCGDKAPRTNDEHTHRVVTTTSDPNSRKGDSNRWDLNRTLPSRSTLKEQHVHSSSGGNQSFTAVHGPLLSTPIMPKVRRAIETNAGLRSPASGRTSLLQRGKPVGRSASLNYGSSNPAKTRAGQVPWVRLKRRESLGLADYISSRAPQSPNTVKLAPPVNSGLPAAPSFRSSPLIVTTEANRSRMLDTQTVVSALREKRKRFGETHSSESMSEDISSWQMSPKRRRQDSSQSNASSVSIPPMPDTLPNLIPTPGTSSMLHIEHLSHQRPSTIPAVDVFSNHLKPGLGGVEQRPHDSVLLHNHSENHSRKTVDLNNSRLAQKALQSSLSSSMRARNNLSLLERGGVDLKRIRNHSSSLQRRASDASTLERNLGEPQAKSTCLQSQTLSHTGATINLEKRSPPPCSASVSSTSPSTAPPSITTVSAPTKRKIAEGVLMRKQSLTMNSPLRSLKTIPSDGLMSTSDFEKDKQKEYQRRVLDLLQPEDKDTVSSATLGVLPSQTILTSAPSGLSLPVSSTSPLASALTTSATSTSSSVAASAASSVSTSIAISASLDSLNKLVQSTNPTVPVSLAPPKSDNTAGSVSVSSVASTTQLAASLLTSGATTTSSTSAPPTGFSFGLQSQSNLSTSSAQAPSLSTSSGFQVNFGSAVSSAASSNTNTSSSNSSTSSVSSAAPAYSLSSTSGLPSSSGFSFGASALSAPSSLAPSQPGGFSFSTNLSNTSGSVASPLGTSSNIQTTTPAGSVSSAPPPYQLGGLSQTSLTSTTANNALSGVSSITTNNPVAAAGTNQAGGFSFGATAAPKPSTSSSIVGAGGFQFGLASSQQTSNTPSTAALPVPQAGGFNFGASQTSISTTASVGGGFSFSAQATSSAPTAFGAASTTTSSNPTPSSLTNPVSATVSATGGLNFGAASALSTSTVPTGFSFNASQPQTNSSSNQATAQPQLATSINPNPILTAPATQPNATGFSFSQNPASSAQSAGFTFGATNAASSQPGPFGNTTNTPVNKNLFGAPSSTATSTISAFGAPSSTATSTNSAFGAPGLGAASSGVFNFGGATNPSTAASSPFGATNAGTTNNPTVFGATNAGTTNNPTAFGNSATTGMANPGLFTFGSTTSANSASSSTPVFGNTTGNNTSLGQSPFGTGANPTPFGSAPASTKPSLFGAPSTATSSVFTPAGTTQPAFGATAPSTNAFGANVTAPGFGSSVGLTTATTPAPAFGSNATTPANQPFVFGAQPSSSNNQPAQPAFGNTLGGSSVFGAGSNPAASSTGGASSVFGNKPATGGASVFGGGLGQTTATNQPTVFGASATPSVFGASQPTPTPAFGSGQSSNVFGASANSTISSPAFGAAPTQQQTTAPAFGSGTQNSAASPFGSSTGFGAPKPNVNPFGAPASTTQGAAFSFTGNQTGQNAASPFGASTTSTASSGFNFGQATQPAANPSGGFSFSATPSTPAFQPTTPNNGGFNFTPGGVSTPSFNFSATTPGTPNMFTPQNPGSAHRPRVAARRGARRGRR